jgi:hypothetical protein
LHLTEAFALLLMGGMLWVCLLLMGELVWVCLLLMGAMLLELL